MPPKPMGKRLASIAKIAGKRRPNRWEEVLLGRDVLFSFIPMSWVPTASLTAPQWRGDAFALLGKVWVLGGYRDDGFLADIEVYDPAAAAWITIPYPFTYFGQAFVATASGKIYAVGGLESCQTLATPVEEYDPLTGIVTQKAGLPTACYRPGIAATADGKIFVIGGCLPPTGEPGGPPSAILPTVQRYNPQTDSWSTVKAMTVARYQCSAVTGADDKIYVIGGTDGSRELDRVDIYNPLTNTWTSAAPMPTARRCLAAALGPDGKIYAVGGLAGDVSLATVEVYDPAANTWNTCTSMSFGRWYLGAAVLGNKIYACGGFMRSGPYQAGNANISALATVEEGTI